jgi:hypothetical protein
MSNAAWITVTTGASGSSNGTVGYSVAANTGGARTGTVTIAGQTFTVTQAAVPTPTCTYSIEPASAAAPAAGSTGSVAVTAGSSCAWTAMSNASWITVTTGASGTGSGTVGYSVAANTGGARTGTVTIAGQTFTVTQAAVPTPTCTYSIEPASAAAPAAGSTGSVAVTAGSTCAWTAMSNASWITVTSGASGSSNGTVGYSVAANTGGARTGTVTIAGQTFTVTQPAPIAVCTYSVSSTTFSVLGIGGTGSVEVTTGSGCSWTATRNDGWIEIISGASGTGSGTVVFMVFAFRGGTRSGTLTVAGHTITVNQSP